MYAIHFIERPSIVTRGDKSLLIFPESQVVVGLSTSFASIFAGRNTITSDEITSSLHEGRQHDNNQAHERLFIISQTFAKLGVTKNGESTNRHTRHGSSRTVDHAVLNLSITERCNLECPHCYSSAGRSASNKRELGTQEIIRLLDQYSEVGRGRETTDIAITGGEPFLRSDLIEILRHCIDLQEKGLFTRVMLNTNGVNVNAESARFLASTGVHIAVSVDGSKPATHEIIRGKGTFRRTLRGIRELVEAGAWVGVNMFAHADNVHDIEATIELSIQLGVRAFTCFNLLSVGRANVSNKNNRLPMRICDSQLYRIQHEILLRRPEFLDLMKDSLYVSQIRRIRARVPTRCGIGRHPTFYVRSNGDIYPCLAIFSQRFRVGNALDEKWPTLWSTHSCYKELASTDQTKSNIPCSVCEVRRFCGGGCFGENVQLSGKLSPPHNSCIELKAGLIELMWILSENPPYLRRLLPYSTSEELPS